MNLRTHLCAAVFAIVATAIAGAADNVKPNSLSQEELADGWVLLFDGESLYGWQPASKADWKVADGVISVGSGQKGLLCTTSEFADYLLKVDFRAPAATNSGVFLHTALTPKNPADDCYELNIAAPAVSPFPTGSFVRRRRAPPKSSTRIGIHTK